MKIKWENVIKFKWFDNFIKFKWFKRLYILYIYGFVVNFRPSSAYVYEFFLNSKNFSSSVVNEDIFPVNVYSSAVLLVPVFPLLDHLRYNPFIIISSLTGIVATSLFIWTNSLTEIQVAQAFQGCITATEIAYFVSIYAHGDVKNYQSLTSYVRAAPLGGKIVSTFLGHLIISQEWLNYKQLYYFDFAAFILSAVLCIFLPPFPQQSEEKSEDPSSNLPRVFSKFLQCFPNKYVVKWSIWSILTISIHSQASIYIQPFWKYLQTTENVRVYNGILDGVYAVVAFTGTILGGVANLDWKFKGDLILSMASLVQAFMLLFVAQFDIIWLNCFCYIAMGFMYHFIMTILCAETAKFLNKGCFGLLFGFVTLIAFTLSSAMVCLLNDSVGLQMEPQDLFMVYGFCDLGVSVTFIVVGLIYWFAKHTYPV